MGPGNRPQHLAVTVSGSSRRHMGAINAAVQELAALSIRVLSPADPRIVAQQGEFLFVASDRVRSVRLVPDPQLRAPPPPNFLLLVVPLATALPPTPPPPPFPPPPLLP